MGESVSNREQRGCLLSNMGEGTRAVMYNRLQPRGGEGEFFAAL